MRRYVQIMIGVVVFLFVTGCGRTVSERGFVTMDDSARKARVADEYTLKIMAFEKDATKRKMNTAAVQPVVRDKTLRQLVRQLQSPENITIYKAEKELIRHLKPKFKNADAKSERGKMIWDLIALLRHPRLETRCAAIRIMVKCYNRDAGKAHQKYIWHVIEKDLTDPVDIVRFTAWQALTEEYGLIAGNPVNVSKKTQKAYMKKWRSWFRKTISRKYNGEIPPQPEE